MTWATPRRLRDLGAPNAYSAAVSPLHARVSGFGGSLSAAIEPGSFKVTLGGAAISGDRVRFKYTIDKGRFLDVKIKGEAGPAKHDFIATPSLRSELSGHLEFAVQGYGLTLKKVTVGKLDLKFGLPPLPAVLKPIEGLVKDLEAKIADAAEDLIGKQLGFDRVFADLDQQVPSQLLDVLNKTADEHGLAQITKLTSFGLDDGRLEAQVHAVQWHGVPSLEPSTRKFGALLQQLAR
jgi:hypothetical protein